MPKKITIDITINAPVEHVWKAYTTPTDITRWNFASDDWYCPSAEADMKVGGAYKARMEAKDGSFGFDFEAVYDEIEPNKALNCPSNRGNSTQRRPASLFRRLVQPLGRLEHALQRNGAPQTVLGSPQRLADHA